MTAHEHLAGQRVMVTGSGGFVGRYVVAALQRAEAEIFEIRSRADCDLGSRSATERRVAEVEPDVVLHLAATPDPPGRSLSLDGFDNTVAATANLVHALPLERRCVLVHIGSYKQYGNVPVPFSELARPQPCCAYGHAKNLSERIVMGAVGGDLDAVYLRFGYIYGPGQPETSLVPTIIQTLLHARSFAAADTVWDAVYVEDAADAILRAATNRECRGSVINVSGGVPHKPLEVLRTLAELMDEELVESRIEPREAPPSHLFGDVRRAHERLGWEPGVDLREGLRRCIDFYAPRRTASVLSA